MTSEMENSDSFAIIDINISDKKEMKNYDDNLNSISEDDNTKNKSPFTTVIKIRKLNLKLILLDPL